MLCHVSADFPLNRRMRKDIARGKLHIVRMDDPADASTVGIPFRAASSPLVCSAVRDGNGNGRAGGGGENEEAKDSPLAALARAAEQGDASAQFNFGLVLAEHHEPQKAVKWIRRAAEQGHVDAQYVFGAACWSGDGISQNREVAAQWIRRAAEQNHDAAQNHLGHMCERGLGIQQDYAEAMKWYRRAAEQNYDMAQNNLGHMCEHGLGIQQDYAEAMKWYHRAAEQGLADAQTKLGFMYQSGKGGTQDYAEAVKWLILAAQQGDVVAHFNLGIAYGDGLGVPQDSAKAFEMYRRAAEHGMPEAQFRLGKRCRRGDGTLRDFVAAAKWHRRAAMQGHTQAQRVLSLMYSRGQGVPQNHREAYIWLSIAAAAEFSDELIGERDKAAKRLKGFLLDDVPSAQEEAVRRQKEIGDRQVAQEPGSEFMETSPPPLIIPESGKIVFDRVWRSVVVVRVEGGQGSGVVVGPDLVATNYHVVNARDGNIRVLTAQNRRANKRNTHSAKIRAVNQGQDICLLSVEGLDAPPATFRSARTLTVGQSVYAVGSPKGLPNSITNGVVSQLHGKAGEAPEIQTSAAISPGSSGGGLFDAEGYLVGVTTESLGGENLNLAIPADWVRELIP